ncbi:2Fe-2S iron-sulfur cluster-binding protein [Aromatoleum petrolei]|uniref:2Fe-2S iron-sulfur cluster binding domain-containing protein n=1 Tax=Aromatoleum petrolei TaxID=76116 RepID=A0ABX1MXD9_9RHOO|nr:2Fe-2S iron-sulfur cluster-binding protein [Aromatoleum petrolei]NMF89727.1 2Fe-2S iron-sulfur cluster binding domain-containing protein [Aromatoleum petrolei]QTQ37368.1 [2Fe-2S] ferredoxin [Aromatoleum petrolei]
MPSVTFVLPDGERREVNVLKGASAMSGAVQSGITGIVAECGGSCACATCHVYVDPSCEGLLPERGTLEDELLDAVAADRRPNSRLSCQIVVTPELDGRLTLHVPETQ